jgi:PAS domain S-box-containing protein
MDYNNFSKQELIGEVMKLNHELQESINTIQAIQRGEVDALVVSHDSVEKVFVLKDANITYRLMIEEMNEGAVTFTTVGTVLYCNKAFARLVGQPVEEITSRPITKFLNYSPGELVKSVSSLKSRKSAKKLIKLTDSKGENIPVQISLHKTAMAEMDIYLMTVTDQREKMYTRKLNIQKVALEKLTSRLMAAREESEQAISLLKKNNLDYAILNHEFVAINNKLSQANEELLLAKKRAEKSDKLKSAFIANMSHEIRTPLNSILGYTKILKERVVDDDKKKYIDVITQSGRHLLNLINDIVDLSRLESDEIRIIPTIVSLNDLMQQTRKQFEAYAMNKEKNHIEFRLKIPKEVNPVIHIDELRVRQVLSNLLSNAFKFTARGTIEFGYHVTDNNMLKFYVSDTGQGISEENQKIVFNRFQQGIRSSRETVAGTGLGLAISKGLVRLLGGEIELQSKEGIGSTFCFTVPLEEARQDITREPERKPDEVAGIPQLREKKVLISEDDFYSREMMIYLLKKTGARLLIAKDGRETIKKFRQNTVDLVLLDIRMPKMDGYEIIRKIRLKNQKIPVIAQTAYAMQEDIRKFRDAGFTDYLTKPINHNELYNVLSRYLG